MGYDILREFQPEISHNFKFPFHAESKPLAPSSIPARQETPYRTPDPKAYDSNMEIVVKLPDDLAQHQNPGREALEALVIEGYRSGAFSHYQASQLLGLSRFQFDGFLKQRNIHEHAYSAEDLDQDEETLRQLQSKGFL
jgi:predicted HTH domain antitoxin